MYVFTVGLPTASGYHDGRRVYASSYQCRVSRVVGPYDGSTGVRVFVVFMTGRQVRHVRDLMCGTGRQPTSYHMGREYGRSIEYVFDCHLGYHLYSAYYVGREYVSTGGRKGDPSSYVGSVYP